MLAESPGNIGALEDATEFLKEELASGQALSREVQDRAKAEGISEKTLRRAKKKLGVDAYKDGYQGEWVWILGSRDDGK